MKIITVDMETFYSREFSLTKLTTEEYIRSPEFEVIGVSVQVGDDEPVWFSGTRKETKEFLQTFDFGSNLALLTLLAWLGRCMARKLAAAWLYWRSTMG